MNADSLASLAPSAASAHEFRELLDLWHDFYLLTGTAAVTLAGLLFIALSLHMEVLVQDKFRGMLVVARATLSSFITVLVVSMMMLAPAVGPRLVGVSLVMFVTIFAIIALLEFRTAMEHDHAEFTRRQVRRRLLMPLVGYALVAWVGVSLVRHTYEMLYSMISAMSLLLANAAWSSWDLLVRVSRVKSRLRAG